MIEPTVGRVVWFWEFGKTARDAGEQPYAATIAFVNHKRSVNIGYLDHRGVTHSRTGILLLQDDDAPPESGCFCEWIPFQKGQAAKTEAMEARLKAQS